jgi:methyltransferase (TIGR00027 family)
MEPPIRNISDTARWTATYRARETERPDALFHDRFARRLAGERGERIAAQMAVGPDTSWAFVIRTYLMDRAIRGRIESGTDLVLNLAAGLDARPYRLDLPGSLRWVEVDLPELLAYKEEVLGAEPPHCRLERHAFDLADAPARRALFAQLGRGLVISEGLLVYFSEEEVGALARELAEAGFDYWLFDLSSPALLQFLQMTTGRHTAEAGAPLRFAPREGVAFFEPFGWTPLTVDPVFEEALALGRVPKEMLAGAPPPGIDGPIWSGICLLRRRNSVAK